MQPDDPDAAGPALQAGRVADCHLGLLLPARPVGEPEAGTVLVVAPASLLHPRVPQPAGRVVHELLTGHPERRPGELVFPADLTVELGRLGGGWTAAGADLDAVFQAVAACWRDGLAEGLQYDGLSFEEARSVDHPELAAVRGQLRSRLAGLVRRARPRRPGDPSP
jgi:hypothetical protein